MTEVNENVEVVETAAEEIVETKEATLEEKLAELEATIISDDYEVTQKDRMQAIAEHMRHSTKLDKAWSLEEIKAFLEMDIEPAKTSNGVYVNDVTRAERKVGNWTNEELVAWALGEIEPVGKANAGALAQSLISRFKLKVTANDPQTAINAYKVQIAKESVTLVTEEPEVVKAEEKPVQESKPVNINKNGLTEMNQQYIEEVLTTYVKELKPGKAVTPEKGLFYQKNLNNLINYIINLPDPAGFKSAMDYLMGVIKKERKNGVFEDTYAMRFTDQLPTGGNVQESHNRLLTLFFIYADGDAAIKKQTDVSYLLQFVKADKQPLLLQYFEQYR